MLRLLRHRVCTMKGHSNGHAAPERPDMAA